MNHNTDTAGWSLQRRLLVQLALVIGMLSVALYFLVRTVAGDAASVTQDGLLGASVLSIAEKLELVDERPFVDLPYRALATLALTGEERIFYSVRRARDGELVTGYDTLSVPTPRPDGEEPVYYDATVDGDPVRAASVWRRLVGAHASEDIVVSVAQTRETYGALTDRIALTAAAVGAGTFVFAAVFGFIAVRRALRPLHALGHDLSGRAADDFRPLGGDVPAEVVPLVRALNGFVERLHVTLETSQHFITEAAHRIRTPLASVSAQTEIARRETDAPATQARLDRVQRAVDQTARVTSQLLSQAMVAYRSGAPVHSRLPVDDLVGAAWRDIEVSADDRMLELHCDIHQGVAIVGDEIALVEALRNLLDNAIKYSPPASVVHVRAWSESDGTIVISVEDQGPGVDEADRARVTERFVRGPNTADTVGSGLGLSIVRQVALAHGGRLDLSRSDDGGLAARIRIPLARPTSAAP